MSDQSEAIRELTAQVSELTGTVRTYMEGQSVLNRSFAENFRNHEADIDSLKEDRSKLKGLMFGLGLGGTSIGAALMKLFGAGQ